MKYIITAYLTLLTLLCSGQSISEINKKISLSDSIIHNRELRIYNRAAITHYQTVLRIYQGEKDDWITEYYICYCSINDKNYKSKVNKVILKPKSDYELLWAKILNTKIEYLPNWDSFQYKLKKDLGIIYEDGIYQQSWSRTAVMDGESYVVQIHNFKNKNLIEYSNPTSYLELYPNVDELEYFNELLKIIQDEYLIKK